MLQCIINNNSMPLNKSCTFQKEMFTSFTGLGFELWITVHWSWSWPDKTNTCNNFFITLNKSRTHSKFSLFYVFSSSLIASLHLSVKCPKDESSRVNMMLFYVYHFRQHIQSSDIRRNGQDLGRRELTGLIMSNNNLDDSSVT